MSQTMVNFRMDEDVKRKMEQACKDMGMSMTTAFTLKVKRNLHKSRKNGNQHK